MPEGDTIFRSARTLNAALAGRVVTAFETVLPALQRVHDDHPIVGRRVIGARAIGKHLLIEFSGALLLRTHMRMSGSWHLYRPGERWQRGRMAMRIVIGTDEYVAVAFDVPVAEFFAAGDLERHAELRALGSDLLDENFSAADGRARLLQRAGTAVCEALLDQRVMAGIGNVFKSEILFACRVNPFRRVDTLAGAECDAIVAKARELLRANVIDATRASASAWGGHRRTTRLMDPGARLWVYGRGGRPCRVCGAPIASRKQGPDARLTYWCPVCQP